MQHFRTHCVNYVWTLQHCHLAIKSSDTKVVNYLQNITDCLLSYCCSRCVDVAVGRYSCGWLIHTEVCPWIRCSLQSSSHRRVSDIWL